MIRIKNFSGIFWSGSKIFSWFLIQDQKILMDFLIRIKNFFLVFWSGSKKIHQKFDPDQKKFLEFLIRINKFGCNIWSGSWLFHDPDHDFFMIQINIHDPDQQKIGFLLKQGFHRVREGCKMAMAHFLSHWDRGGGGRRRIWKIWILGFFCLILNKKRALIFLFFFHGFIPLDFFSWA